MMHPKNSFVAIVCGAAASLMLASCSGSGVLEGAAAPCTAQKLDEKAPSGMAQQSICILSRGRAHAFTVEMAITPEEGMRGLMFRRELAADKGMLFPFIEDQPAGFWMKNTYIPLDMIFIRRNGTIESILENVEPTTLEPRLSRGPVAAVLEISGGRSAELGLKAGDKVQMAK